MKCEMLAEENLMADTGATCGCAFLQKCKYRLVEAKRSFC